VASGRPTRIVAGITGLERGGVAARALAQMLTAAFALAEDAVEIHDDMHIAFLGAFDPGAGILVYAGTGSIAYHLTRDLEPMRAGGHGYLVDDAGAGFWIGQQALRAVWRRRDEGGAPTALTRAIDARIGADDWPAARAFIYAGGRAAVASVAPCCAAAADAGDATAVAILETAGAELARLARVLIARLGVLPVAIAGGAIDGRIWSAFRAALPECAEVRRDDSRPVDTAARLAGAKLRS
jgi:N-acetylglucosamine kinase-like BadF-type ATPase